MRGMLVNKGGLRRTEIGGCIWKASQTKKSFLSVPKSLQSGSRLETGGFGGGRQPGERGGGTFERGPTLVDGGFQSALSISLGDRCAFCSENSEVLLVQEWGGNLEVGPELLFGPR